MWGFPVSGMGFGRNMLIVSGLILFALDPLAVV